MSSIHQFVLSTPCGALNVRIEDNALTGIDFMASASEAVPPSNPLAVRVSQRLQQYFESPQMDFDLPVAPAGTPFQKRVWQAIAAIPSGKTVTYTELAAIVDSGPRAVANACGANPLPVIIPCHRVVARNGLGGFMQGREQGALSIKQWLLAHERGESRTFG